MSGLLKIETIHNPSLNPQTLQLMKIIFLSKKVLVFVLALDIDKHILHFTLVMLSLYLHIPFCASKCAYCSFNSMPIDSSDTLIDRYVEALKKEIDYYSETLEDKELKTLYF
ncbi:MAG: hypothetical protein WCL18_00670 [bacterium]